VKKYSQAACVVWYDGCCTCRAGSWGRDACRANPRRIHLRGVRGEVFLTRRKLQRGQAIIILALALPILFGMVGLAFDIGYLEFMQRRAQTAADAAALAGAVGLPYGTATASARAGAALNGFTNGTSNVTVVVNNPPNHGPNASNTNYVEAIVSQKEPVFFLRMAGIGPSTTVSARAVATNTSGDCIFALASSGVGLNVPFLADINTPNCAIIVDSSSSNALSGFLGFFTASQIGVVGGGLRIRCGVGGLLSLLLHAKPGQRYAVE